MQLIRLKVRSWKSFNQPANSVAFLRISVVGLCLHMLRCSYVTVLICYGAHMLLCSYVTVLICYGAHMIRASTGTLSKSTRVFFTLPANPFHLPPSQINLPPNPSLSCLIRPFYWNLKWCQCREMALSKCPFMDIAPQWLPCYQLSCSCLVVILSLSCSCTLYSALYTSITSLCLIRVSTINKCLINDNNLYLCIM